MKYRFDRPHHTPGAYHYQPYMALLAFSLPDWQPLVIDYLMTVYSLKPSGINPTPRKHAAWVTHEAVYLHLDPVVRIDYEVSLFDQRHLVPVLPPKLVWQFKAATDEIAFTRIADSIMWLLSRPRRPTIGEVFANWMNAFPEGIPVVNNVGTANSNQ